MSCLEPTPRLLGLFIDRGMPDEETFNPCDHIDEIRRRIMDAILDASCSGSPIVQAGDESYDLPGYLKALRELYEWLDVACAKQESAVAIISHTSNCGCSHGRRVLY